MPSFRCPKLLAAVVLGASAGCTAFNGAGDDRPDPAPASGDAGALADAGAPSADASPPPGSDTLFASLQTDVTALATDGTSLAWTARGDGAVRACALSGCTQPRDLAKADRPIAIAYRHRFLWASEGSKVVSFLDDAGNVGSYTLNNAPSFLCSDGVEVFAAGSAIVKLVGDVPYSDTTVAGIEGPARSCAATAGAFVWSTTQGVLLCPSSGCAAAPTVVGAGESATALGIDGSQIVWLTESGRLRARDVKGGAPSDVVVNLPSPVGIALDPVGAYVYFTAAGTSAKSFLDGFVARVPRGGGPMVVLANDQAKPGPLLVTKDAVFWANALDSTIRRVAK